MTHLFLITSWFLREGTLQPFAGSALLTVVYSGLPLLPGMRIHLPTLRIVNCRIRTERNGGAWCPKQPISRDTYEWLEIDLHELKVVTQVETQGRFGYGQVRALPVNHSVVLVKTSSSAAAERPLEPLSQLKSCQLLHNCTKNHI